MSCSNNHRIARSGAPTLSSTYGIYNGFELLEHDPIAGREEYLDSEKYQIKVRDWEKPGNIKPYIRDLNRARRANAALQQTSNLRFIPIEDGNVIGFVKESVDQTNTVVWPSRGPASHTNSGFRSAMSRSACQASAATSPPSKT